MGRGRGGQRRHGQEELKGYVMYRSIVYHLHTDSLFKSAASTISQKAPVIPPATTPRPRPRPVIPRIANLISVEHNLPGNGLAGSTTTTTTTFLATTNILPMALASLCRKRRRESLVRTRMSESRIVSGTILEASESPVERRQRRAAYTTTRLYG